MITKLTHASVYVLDQEKALDFYVNKLGFVEKMKFPMENGILWITVSPKEQPELEIILMPVYKTGDTNDPAAQALADLVQKGTFGAGVLECKDCFATYQELKDKGVEFTKTPTKEFYGTEALFKDNSGNWFSLVQRPG